MNNWKKCLLLFLIVALIQISVPLYMAWRWENILTTGQRVYWVTAPVDPYDAFKGRYIDLRFQNASGPNLDQHSFAYGESAYAWISETADGKAYIQGVSARLPEQGPYVTVKISYTQGDTIHVDLPFKRYYLPENYAAAAETAYRKAAGKSGTAAVRIKDGYGVIEQVFLEGHPLEEYLNN